MNPLARLDHRYVWHPFTQMQDWLKHEPIVITDGHGAVIRDAHGREYLDANASIWTNLHGHRHPRLNAALRRQLNRIAHCSALGLANDPASRLAEVLVRCANPRRRTTRRPELATSPTPMARGPRLEKVFYSDNGSTALEVALKLAWEYCRRTRGHRNPGFLSLEGAYHGDTLGAVALGHIDLFHAAFRGLLFKTDRVMAPYCYRCPYNRAQPARADARSYRDCRWECVDHVEVAFAAARQRGRPYAAWVYEPGIQGAAGMVPQPEGWLTRTADIARSHGALLIADEVLTGFGRTGGATGKSASLFAGHREAVQPDFLCLAKGLTGGYLPMAATLTSRAVFDAFLGRYDEFKTFFHGHSFTANPLGAAAALASLDLLQSPAGQSRRVRLESDFAEALDHLWVLPQVGDIRRVGLIAGIELVRDWRTREPFPIRERVGIRVCEAMARRGVLTRPVGNVIVILPPYCTTRNEVRRMITVLAEAVTEVLDLKGLPTRPSPRVR